MIFQGSFHSLTFRGGPTVPLPPGWFPLCPVAPAAGRGKKRGLGACIQPCCCPFFAPANPWISLSLGLSQRPCSCPRLWIGFEGKCFYFSDMEKNQTWSRADCHTHGANLAVIQSRDELVFVLCYNGSPYYWIALSHQNLSQRWECDDVTQFDSSLFPIGGGEDFAFLNNQRVTSARSSGERHWICTRQL
uniref:C-type lectin domain-containing protein n=1 Tax=Anas platyrhynchos TaxID=8839 RepID=A0A8B9QWY9_ANAPL